MLVSSTLHTEKWWDAWRQSRSSLISSLPSHPSSIYLSSRADFPATGYEKRSWSGWGGGFLFSCMSLRLFFLFFRLCTDPMWSTFQSGVALLGKKTWFVKSFLLAAFCRFFSCVFFYYGFLMSLCFHFQTAWSFFFLHCAWIARLIIAILVTTNHIIRSDRIRSLPDQIRSSLPWCVRVCGWMGVIWFEIWDAGSGFHLFCFLFTTCHYYLPYHHRIWFESGLAWATTS